MITQTVERRGASAAEPSPQRPGGPADRRRDRAIAGTLTYGGYLVLQVLQLLLLHRLAPRFFWYDDSQAQFGPMTWWLGRQQQGGRPPLMDPEQGQAGNLVADMQYGALDPLHWGLQALAARTDDVVLMSWVFAALCTVLLGTGILVLLRHHGVHRALAVAGALGTASSGFFLWYGSAWWPLMWSVAFLPWFWWGLVARRTWGTVVLAVATWALLASGNPYVLFFALALILAQAAELVRNAGSPRVLLGGAVLARLLAMLGGLAMALPTLLSTVQVSEYMSRQGADPLVGNIGFGVTNLADVLLGSPTLMGQTNAWSGSLGLVPAMYTLVGAVAAVALVDWRRALNSPGVLTAAVVCGLAVVFTQLPTTVSVFRYPVRYLVVVQVTLPVLVLLAITAAPLLTRRRVTIAGGLVGAQALLALFRAPVFYKWHLLAAVVTVAALVALVVLADRSASRLTRPPRRGVVLGAAGLVVVAAWGTVFVGERMMVSLADRSDVVSGTPDQGDDPFRVFGSIDRTGTTVDEYRDRSAVVDGSATVIAFGFGADSGWPDGVMRGNGNLLADFATGTGSFAVWQAALNERWCRTYAGATCGDPQALLAEAPSTGLAWVDLLSSDRVLLAGDAPEVLRRHFEENWTSAGSAGAYAEYRRDDGLPGRLTSVRDVDVSQQPGDSGLAYADTPMDTYTVSTGGREGSLVTRIPWWPGIEATLDGQPLTVGSVDGAVVSVAVPADVEQGTLEISYVPVGERILAPSFVAAGILSLAALVLWTVVGRRGRGDAERAPSAADHVPGTR